MFVVSSTFGHTMALQREKEVFENNVENGENTGIISFSHKGYHAIMKNCITSVTMKLSSANALNLDKARIISFGKRLSR